MPLTDLITPGGVLPALRAAGKKQLLQELAARAAPLAGLDERLVLEALQGRERLGSTGVGEGVAIPHAQMAGAKGLTGLFARLDKPVDFEALDGAPVDLVFLLIAPERAGADHLKALARAARALRDPALTAKLRVTRDADALRALLERGAAPHAA